MVSKRTMKSKLILVFTVFELIIIGVLGCQIFKKQRNTPVAIIPIKKETITFEPSDKLKSFYELTPSSHGEDVNSWAPVKAKYAINSDSLNERFEYEVKKLEKVYRIITLGDSFTFGLGVDTQDNWTEQLEDLLNKQLSCSHYPKFEVINLGTHSYDT